MESDNKIERGSIGGSVRQVRSSGRFFLRQLERIEKSGGYPTDEQVRVAVTTAEFLLQSKSERAQGLGAALILKAREGATRRGMSILKLSEEARRGSESGNTFNINGPAVIQVAGACWEKA